jgi:phosphohistidine phosphatase SixA
MRIIWLLCLFSIVSSASADESLWQKIKQDPNMIVLMRNAESSGNRDGINMLRWDASGKCDGESTLTDEGKAHAAKIGAAFSRHGIKPIVISSPMCRCTETAEIAFGEYVSDPELRQKSPEDTNGQNSFQAKATELLYMHRGSTPIAFVNHRPNIDSLTLELIEIGDLLVGAVTEDGEVDIVGKIRIEP